MISICIKHDKELIPLDDGIRGRCPVDGEIYALSHITEEKFCSVFPSVSTMNRAYNPVWGGSTIEHIKEIRKKYLFSRKW